MFKNDKTPSPKFSINALRETNPRLAASMTWGCADWSQVSAAGRHVQFGCGDNVIPEFVNLDFLPSGTSVIGCNLLDVWPERLASATQGFYSEDVIEHFYMGEQLYLLCSMNYLSEMGATSRVLMPDIDRLWAFRDNFDYQTLAARGDYFVTMMGCMDAIQAINTGMRMGGHRWLHNRDSFDRLARLAGFVPYAASCTHSRDPAYDGLNIRGDDSISFATDLVKGRHLKRVIVPPKQVLNAELVEVIDENQSLYVSTTIDPALLYEFPEFAVDRISLINVRCANVSEFSEHNFSKAYFRLDETAALYTDRTMQSAHFMNTFTSWDVARKAGPGTLSSLRFDPGERPGDYFIAGPIEIFVYQD